MEYEGGEKKSKNWRRREGDTKRKRKEKWGVKKISKKRNKMSENRGEERRYGKKEQSKE
jgi:hypothetical protein